MNKSIDAQVTCPYYLREAGSTVNCAGIVDGTETVLSFSEKRAKKLFMKSHCLDCAGGGCGLAEYFNHKYGWRK